MELFENEYDKSKNLLSVDGTAHYFGSILNETQASNYQALLQNTIEWRNDELMLFGKKITTKRKVAWYGSKPFKYSYSNTTKMALPWTAELLELKKLIEKITNESFNSCLLNFYHNGNEGMGWHSDAEKELQKEGAIASISLGAERKFVFKHRNTKEKVTIVLKHGSLLIMKNQTQNFWMHCLPPTKKILVPRINLTFRTIEEWVK